MVWLILGGILILIAAIYWSIVLWKIIHGLLSWAEDQKKRDELRKLNEREK